MTVTADARVMETGVGCIPKGRGHLRRAEILAAAESQILAEICEGAFAVLLWFPRRPAEQLTSATMDVLFQGVEP